MTGESFEEPEHVEYLSEDDLLALIRAELGTEPVVRDWGLVAAAVGRPQATVFGEPAYPGLAGRAAALMHSIVTTHPLVDGNKRIGVASMLLFYALNGIRLRATDDELFDLTMALADPSDATVVDAESLAYRLAKWESPLRPGDAL